MNVFSPRSSLAAVCATQAGVLIGAATPPEAFLDEPGYGMGPGANGNGQPPQLGGPAGGARPRGRGRGRGRDGDGDGDVDGDGDGDGAGAGGAGPGRAPPPEVAGRCEVSGPAGGKEPPGRAFVTNYLITYPRSGNSWTRNLIHGSTQLIYELTTVHPNPLKQMNK